MWSLADLCDVAWFATVEAETMMRVPLHWVGAIQVHGLGTEDVAGAEGQEEGEAVAAVKVTAGEEWNEKVWLAAALGCMSWKCLHWLSRREALHFHSTQVVGVSGKTVSWWLKLLCCPLCLQRSNTEE